ncbi:hypothetical protein DFS28_11778 [Pseudomonas sp. 478]|jgi:hypothetical protein|uniref:hypothetical protein n=1 Tax=unclassified Pseudomonas TaxID=196821 RepID=UPI000DB4C011|nr:MULTISPECIES: hypothetical protein [unclassified Pseudomonas]PZW90510.1 hypothetical protein DFS28_11778 [Pseudomonas sp. 478]TCV46191.1 hypothetical protein EDB99_11879 [Pseudomonas sp. 460]
MTVQVVLHTLTAVKQTPPTWKQDKKTYETGNKRNPCEHAEMLAFNARGGANIIYLAQNAFPCQTCHDFLIANSATCKVIINIQADEGSYSLDHKKKLGVATVTVPYTFYYPGTTAGTAKMVAGSNVADAPAGFPAIPAFTAYW